MADVSKIQLPNGTTYTIKDLRIPTASSSDNGKVVMINSNGQFVIANLPVYDGSVSNSQNS